MKIARRGRFKTVVNDDTTSVTYIGSGTVAKAPHLTNDKMYVTLAPKDTTFLADVDAFIRSVQPIEFSPLFSSGDLVVKILPRALVDKDLAAGDAVEFHLTLGNFGAFGYCWTATSLFKPM